MVFNIAGGSLSFASDVPGVTFKVIPSDLANQDEAEISPVLHITQLPQSIVGSHGALPSYPGTEPHSEAQYVTRDPDQLGVAIQVRAGAAPAFSHRLHQLTTVDASALVQETPMGASASDLLKAVAGQVTSDINHQLTIGGAHTAPSLQMGAMPDTSATSDSLTKGLSKVTIVNDSTLKTEHEDLVIPSARKPAFSDRLLCKYTY
jgi:hypothetical protein